MTALLNTAGKDTAERLARLETALVKRDERPAALAQADCRPASGRAATEAKIAARLDAMLTALLGAGQPGAAATRCRPIRSTMRR